MDNRLSIGFGPKDLGATLAALVAMVAAIWAVAESAGAATQEEIEGAVDARRFGEAALWVQASETVGGSSGVKGGPLILPGSTITGCWLWIGLPWDQRQEAGLVVQTRDLGPDRIFGTADDGRWSNICETFVHNHDIPGGYADDDVYRTLDVPLTYPHGAVWRIHWQTTLRNIAAGFVAKLKMVLERTDASAGWIGNDGGGRADPTDGMAQLFPRLWRR